MQAFLIDPEQQTIEAVTVDTTEQLSELIGYATLESDDLGNGDQLIFDEECFIRGTAGRFQIDKLIPVAGKAIVIGGQNQALSDVNLDLATLQSRLVFK